MFSLTKNSLHLYHKAIQKSDRISSNVDVLTQFDHMICYFHRAVYTPLPTMCSAHSILLEEHHEEQEETNRTARIVIHSLQDIFGELLYHTRKHFILLIPFQVVNSFKVLGVRFIEAGGQIDSKRLSKKEI